LVYLKLKSDVIRKKKIEYVETSQHEFENQTLNKSGKCFGSQTIFFFHKKFVMSLNDNTQVYLAKFGDIQNMKVIKF